MKRKHIGMIVAIVILTASLSFALDVRLLGHDYWVQVEGQMRLIKVHWDKDGQHLEYFKDDAGHIVFLGEEVFQDDLKISDSYIENNGAWPKGYNRRFR